jgi:NADPH:quinone reductase
MFVKKQKKSFLIVLFSTLKPNGVVIMIKAIAIKEAGEADTLKVVELPNTTPQENDVVIEQSFVGVNYGDAIRRKRGLFELNEHGYFVPGFEGIGKVISVGSNVQDFKLGDRVGYLSESGGGYSQQICVNEKLVFRVPNNISDETAAVMTCVGATAWHLTNLSKIGKDSWVLIHGATGGVGLLLVQLCLLKGAKVIAVVGTQGKKDFLKRYDVTETIVRGEGDISQQIIKVTNGQGIDAIFDCVGQAVLDTNMNCIRKGGVILYYGSTSGHPSFPGMQILMNSLRVQGFNIFTLVQDTSTFREGMRALFLLISERNIEIYIDKVFKMEDAHLAHQLLEGRNSIGKLLIDLR